MRLLNIYLTLYKMKRLEVLKPNGEIRIYIMPNSFYIEDGEGFTRLNKQNGEIILQLPHNYAWCILDFLEKSNY